MQLRMLALAMTLPIVLLGGAPASSTNPLAKLGIWQGRWTGETQSFRTKYTNAGRYSWTQDCDWMPNHSYMDCDWLSNGVEPDAGTVVNNLSMFTYSNVDKAYKHMGITRDRQPLYEQVSVSGETWTTPYTISYKGKAYDFRDVYQFVSPNKFVLRFYISDDGGRHWILTKQGQATKA